MTKVQRVFVTALLAAILSAACIAYAGDSDTISVDLVDANSKEAVTAAKAAGIAAAQNDIRSCVFRLRDYGEPIPPEFYKIDPETGYHIQRIHNCDASPTKAFLAEIEAYNHVMRDWHKKHK